MLRSDAVDGIPVMNVPQLLQLLVLVIALSITAPTADARDLRAVSSALTKKLVLDRQRNAATKAVPLAKPKTVHRYTSVEQARRESRRGLEPGAHMTANARRGRPLTAENAQQRYGMPTTPSAGETIRLLANTLMRPNKVLVGPLGYGEITSRTHPAGGGVARRWGSACGRVNEEVKDRQEARP